MGKKQDKALAEIWKMVGTGGLLYEPEDVVEAVADRLANNGGMSYRQYEEKYLPKIAEHKRNDGPHEWGWELRCKVCGIMHDVWQSFKK